jgi:carboxylate-amine ligase
MLGEYGRVRDAYDEAVRDDGTPRHHAAPALEAVARRGPAELVAAVQERLSHAEVGFQSLHGGSAFLVDPVPRVLAGHEWDHLEGGLAQRTRALDRFVADVYGERVIVAEGVIPARVLDSAEHLEPRAAGARPAGPWIGIAGLDVVREPGGEFRVLEDNVRTPSGIGYAVAARAVVSAELEVAEADRPRPLDDAPALLGWVLRAAAPPGAPQEPRIAVLTDGASNSAYWEQRWLAGRLGVPVVTPDALEHRAGRLALRDGPVLDVVYRRTNADRLDTPVGALLEAPWRAGLLGVVNAFGTGVADDKLVHAYVEDMVRFYLGEEPVLRSVETLDLLRPGMLERALDELERLVIKPRGGYGGVGVVICAHAERSDLERVREDLRAHPEGYVAQELVMLSTHPTVAGGRLAPRHVDLRPFVFLGPDGEARVLPGGLTRVAFAEGALVVNSSQSGGAKDTWVLP